MTEFNISVLFLTRYPLVGASSRYRVYQYVPYFEKMGIKVTTQSFMDDKLYEMSQQPGRTFSKLLASVRAVYHRARILKDWKSYDVIYMQRELLPFGPPLVERWLKRRGAVLLFDYDDALFIKKASRYNPIATFLRNPDKIYQLFKIVDCTIAGNDWLRDSAIAAGGNAVTVEVAEDTSRIPLRNLNRETNGVTIGWLGSPSTVKYLREIEEPLKLIAKQYPNTKFEITGGGQFEMQGVPWRCFDWSLENELNALSRFDIGLMPLPMEPWAQGKSGGKARTYMAAGVIPVCTAIGYNLQLIRDGDTGYLCNEKAGWYDILEKLIVDSALRSRVAMKARQEVEERFSPQKQSTLLAEQIVAIYQSKRRQS